MGPVWRQVGEGIVCCHDYLMVQTGKNPPARQETWGRSLGWEDLLEEGMATHSSILAGRIPTDRGAWWATVPGLLSQRVAHD